MSKQLIGTNLYLIDSSVNVKIPVAQSQLPVQKVKGDHDLPKEMIYCNDARNPHFEFTLKCSNGIEQSSRVLQFSKEGLALFFRQLQAIQDELNTYM